MEERAAERPLPDTRNAGAAYWKAAARGQLSLPWCKTCGQAFWYPRWHCPGCGGENLEWTRARGTGRVYTFTVVRQSGDPYFKTRVPFVVAMIELDEGPRLMANVIDCAPESVRIGMAVSVAFEPVSAEVAIPVFRPVGPAAT